MANKKILADNICTNPSDYSTDGFAFEEFIYSVGVIPVTFLNIFEK